MTREEAIEVLEDMPIPPIDGCDFYDISEALNMAIEALKRERTDEWCTGCKEYDTKKKCCPRFNKVIREAMKREPSEDGTLEVKVEDATKVGRVLISDDKHRGGLYYPDEYEPQGISFENDTKIKSCSKDSDLISRAEAIEAIELVDWYHQNSNKDMVHGANSDEHQAWYKADDVCKALEAVPSADRPKGEWIHTPNGIDRDFVWWTCSECGHKIFSETEKDRIEFHAYCGRCGADMRSE